MPLRIATYIGFTLALSGLAFAAFFALKKLFTPEMPMGWASSIVTSLVLGGVQLGCLGIIGEYLGRIFIHLNVQPQYVIRNLTDQEEPTSEPKNDIEPAL